MRKFESYARNLAARGCRGADGQCLRRGTGPWLLRRRWLLHRRRHDRAAGAAGRGLWGPSGGPAMSGSAATGTGSTAGMSGSAAAGPHRARDIAGRPTTGNTVVMAGTWPAAAGCVAEN